MAKVRVSDSLKEGEREGTSVLLSSLGTRIGAGETKSKRLERIGDGE